MKISDILTDESRWTQYADARDKDEEWRDACSDSAVKFSLFGAAMRVYGGGQALEDAMVYLADAIGLEDKWYEDLEVGIKRWNNAPKRTFAEVRQVIEKADV
jgi:hypothetical protein